MTDPIIKAAVDLKKEVEDVNHPEINKAMDEIMKLLMGAIVAPADNKKS